jgi:hypothetical protein
VVVDAVHDILRRELVSAVESLDVVLQIHAGLEHHVLQLPAHMAQCLLALLDGAVAFVVLGDLVS